MSDLKEAKAVNDMQDRQSRLAKAARDHKVPVWPVPVNLERDTLVAWLEQVVGVDPNITSAPKDWDIHVGHPMVRPLIVITGALMDDDGNYVIDHASREFVQENLAVGHMDYTTTWRPEEKNDG